MSKDKISDYDGVTAGNNTDIGGISIDEGMLPSTVNNSLRELTKQLGAFADGTDGIDVLTLQDDDASASIKIQAPSTVTTTTTFTLPDGDGTNGYALVTNGSGTLSWASAGGLANIADDTTPQLGGTLDANGNSIDMGTNIITDTKVGQWDTAYGWGDHGTEGYLTGNQTITLTGDVSGSGTTAITVTVADDSHNHVISNVDGLQTALDAKLPLTGGTMTGDISFGDNDKATFGDAVGGDLQIYHDGLNSYIQDKGTGDLFVDGDNNLTFRTGDGLATKAKFTTLGAAELYYSNSKTLETTSTGVNVFGSVTADGLTVDGVATFNNNYVSFGNNGYIRSDASNELRLQSGTSGTNITNSTNSKYISNFANNGDISFYADNGTTQGLYWDASTQRLGLGTTSPNGIIHVKGADTVEGDAKGQIVIRDTAAYNANPTMGILFQGEHTSGSQAYMASIFGAKENATNGNYSGYLAFATRSQGSTTSERMRLDSSGRLGLGTTSPDRRLQVKSDENNVANTTIGLAPSLNDSVQGGLGVGAGGLLSVNAVNAIQFRIGGSDGDGTTEVGRFDSSGFLLVGKTSSNFSAEGIELKGSHLQVTRANNLATYFNRTGTDGDISGYYKDGTKVGAIGTEGSQTYIVTGDTGLKFAAGVDAVVPVNAGGANRDNAIDLGVSSVRFKDFYLSGGVYAGSGFGSNGQLLTSNGTTATWQDAPAGGAGYFQGENGITGDATNGLGDIFRVHEDTLNTNVTIASGNNALCAGPLTIATGVTLTVNGNLSIV